MTERRKSIGKLVLDLFGSYGLACLLLLCLFILTIRGTWHQKDAGLYEAKKIFFESWFVWGEFAGVKVPTFPGGVLVMSLLAINMIIGGLWRLRINQRTIGVAIIHVGIAFMMFAGLVKLETADEGYLTLFEGRESDHFVDYHLWEVAIWNADAAQSSGGAVEHLITDDVFADLAGDRTRTFTSSELPFDVALSNFVPHCNVMPKGPMWEATGPVVDGFAMRAMPVPEEAERAVAGVHVAVNVGGETQRAILWGYENYPWTVEADGQTWALTLRHRRYPMPFTIQLEDFQKEEHPGTGIAKSYRSFVLRKSEDREDRVLIEMNEPLREGGLVLFQSGWGPQDAPPGAPLYSTFSVVDNPSDKWPEYSLWVITAGMLITFLVRLTKFLGSESRKRMIESGTTS